MKVLSKEERDYRALEYLKNQIRRGKYPSYKELQKKFNLHYFKINFKKLYLDTGINCLYLPIKRPAGCQVILKKELIKYVKNEINKNHYPSRRELEHKFRVKIGLLFGGIEHLYLQAGCPYIKKNSQKIKEEKAKILTNIVLKLLSKLDLTLIKRRNVNQKGIDILAKDYEGKKIGVEIKAFNKYESIKRKNINQIRVLMKKEKLKKVILITTASKVSKNVSLPENVSLILYDKLKDLCDEEVTKQLNHIRNYSVHIKTSEHETKRNKIIELIKNETKKGHKVSVISINKSLKIDIYTYFKNFYEIMEKAGVCLEPKMIRHIRNHEDRSRAKSILINNILKFMENETKKGYYPTAEDIKKNFSISHIWNYISMSDLYKKLNLPPYLEREHRIKRIKLLG